MTDQGLYILSVPGNYWKIGLAFDVHQRIKQLQTGCPEKIAMYYFCDPTSSDVAPLEMERQLHKRLSAYQTAGEWFHAPEKMINVAFKEVWVMLSRPDIYARWEKLRAHCRASWFRRQAEKRK